LAAVADERSSRNWALTLASTRIDGAATNAALAHRQPLLAIQPVNAVLARRLAFPPQQHEQSPIAEPTPFNRQVAQALTQRGIRRTA
jgi:hypothetical protein